MMVGLVAGGETEEKERGPVWRSRPDSPFLPVSSVGASCELVASQSGLSTTALGPHPSHPQCPHSQSTFPLSFLCIFAAFPGGKQKPGPTSSFSWRAKLSLDKISHVCTEEQEVGWKPRT